MKSLLRKLLAKANMLPVVLMLLLSGVSTQVLAFSNYLSDFNANYNTQGTRIDNCGLCHYNFNGGGPRTPYGEDFRNNNFSVPSVGSLDSDGDGQTNDQEAAGLTYPGLSCSNLISTQNAPADIADFVDPNNPGCVGVGSPPIVNMNGPYVGVTGSPISFSSAGSTDPDGTIVSYLWNFGSGYGTSTEANPTFTYTLTFQAKILVTLTVTDNDGNTSNSSTFVTVLQTPNSPPVADAGAPVTGVVNSPVQFDGSASSDPENGFLSYRWDFGDGTIGGLVSPTHSYNRCGTYNVSLTVSDNVTLTNSASTTATIASSGVDLPVAHAGGGAPRLYDGQVGTNVPFDGSGSFDPDCNIVTYSWNFGDGTSGTGMSPLHSYTAAGDYVVTLTVTDNDGLQAIDVATVSVIDTGPLNGEALYQTNCATCHGAGANSTKIGATVARIDTGITSVPAMNSLSTLTATEVQAISDYLVSLTPPPPPPPGPVDGATLYDTNCAGCHGPGDSSAKAGATAARINNGIASVPSMSGLSSLSAADIDAIAAFLSAAPAPTTPQGLYVANCGSCHGADGSGGVTGEDVRGDSASNISEAIKDESEMQSLSFLSAQEIQLISDFLNGITSPPPGGGSGEAIYAANCASCHGAGATSAKSGATVARINNGIANVPSMNGLSSLSAADIQAVSDYLVSLAPTPPPGTGNGETLYSTNCAGCHGPGGSSAKAGATIARINNGITSVPSMSSLSSLSAADVEAIAAFLSSAPAPTTPQELYVANCGSCHGADGSGGITGEDVRGDSAGKISEAIQKESEMQTLSFLSSEEIQLISDFLNGIDTAPPGGGSGGGDGLTLYANNCAGCHGPGDSSAKAGATAARINSGIASVPSMSGLSSLTAAEVDAIAAYLSTAAPPTTPEGLYAANCGSCHGADGSGGITDKDVRGDSAGKISEAIQDESEMRFLGFLSRSELQLIAEYLGSSQSASNDGDRRRTSDRKRRRGND